jgi:hypothetical protein
MCEKRAQLINSLLSVAVGQQLCEQYDLWLKYLCFRSSILAAAIVAAVSFVLLSSLNGDERLIADSISPREFAPPRWHPIG